MDTRFDQNETELAILVLAVALKVLADGDSLLDEEVKILRDLRGEAYTNHSVSLGFDQTEANMFFSYMQIAYVCINRRYRDTESELYCLM